MDNLKTFKRFVKQKVFFYSKEIVSAQFSPESIYPLSDPPDGDPYSYYKTYKNSLTVIRLPGILIVTIGFANPSEPGKVRQILVDNVFVWN